MQEWLLTMADWHVMEWLFVAAVVLILIDYYFPVDYPAYLGYLCFAGGMFFALPLPVVPSALIAVAIFVICLLLHWFWFSKYLTNAQEDRASPGEPS
jgi:membrane protein implicated in regulation of membrane protease activity